MQTVHLEPTDKTAREIAAATFPEYRGRKFVVEVTEKVWISDRFASGGTRSEYRALDLSSGKITEDKTRLRNPLLMAPGNVNPTIDLPPGVVIVSHRIFCGKDHGLRFYIHPQNTAKLLPAPVELSWAQKVVLAATRSTKNTYGGETNLRFKEANRVNGIDQRIWEETKALLIQRKMLNRAGSITVPGKNAIGDTMLHELERR